MYIAILGRQPEISLAELESLYTGRVTKAQDGIAIIDDSDFDFEKLGGSSKAGRIVTEMPRASWDDVHTFITQRYSDAWKGSAHKITLGISVYGASISTKTILKTGLKLKQSLRQSGSNLRLIPNMEPALNTATSHHNKLGLSSNKVELIIAFSGRSVIIAESVGAQNITALASRDQARPKTDAFVGMLPPKLARIMVNIAAPNSTLSVLDPFCGTGVILQEALLLDHPVYGSDLSEKMVDYSKQNLAWLTKKYHHLPAWHVEHGDAMKHAWTTKQFEAIASEVYLGQPFSAPPSPQKLREVRKNCDYITRSFLHNLSSQIKSGSRLCIAVPAWRDTSGNTTHLPIASELESLGYRYTPEIDASPLLYFRPNQVVARQLLSLEKA